MRKFNVAFIGAGKRSVVYASAYAGCDNLNVAALADPSADHRKTMMSKAGLKGSPAEYADWRELLAKHRDLDGVVIAAPNHLHADAAVACLDRGLAVALEKPIATTQADCERILVAERANGGRTLIGFVLRSSPLYLKIHELISGGAIGRVVSVQADELVDTGVSSVMFRNPWRRLAASSGGSLLEKCCHDMDILNWMMASRPVSLNSYGQLAIFRPDASLPQTCDGCKRAGQCKYYRKPATPGQDFIRLDERCIYNIEKECVDVQTVQIEYESGAMATFLMNFDCMGPRTGRNFHAVGTGGRVWASTQGKKVWLYDNASGKTTEFDAAGDGSGHGGGDRKHALTLREMMADRAVRPECNASAGYLSAVMCFAADASRTQRRRVDLRYQDNGLVKVV